MGLIFAEFAKSLKSPKIDKAKNKPYLTSLLRVLEIANTELGENLTHLPRVIFAKIFRREKFPIYGILLIIKISLCHNFTFSNVFILFIFFKVTNFVYYILVANGGN